MPNVPSPATQRCYTVQVFRDGEYVGELGADAQRDLDELLYTLALRYCTEPRRYELTPEGWIDRTKPIPRPRIEVAIWDSAREHWSSPDGLRGRSEPWLWPVKVTVNVGSYRIE